MKSDTCKRGHALTPGNTYVNPKTGKRRCNTCHAEWKLNRVAPPCSVCGKPVVARKLCSKHYEAWSRHGDPLGPPAEDRSDSGEEWRPVMDWEDLYEVSDRGRVWSIRSRRTLKLRTNSDGYPEVALCRNRTATDGRQVTIPVHRLVAAAFLGPRPDGQGVRHLDGNPQNNRPSNLAYGTQLENMHDAIGHQTHIGVRRTERSACKNGHDYEPGGFYVNRDGAKVCRQCDREKSARYEQRKRQAKVSSA